MGGAKSIAGAYTGPGYWLLRPGTGINRLHDLDVPYWPA